MNETFRSFGFNLSDMTEEQLTKLEESIAQERRNRRNTLREKAREMFKEAFNFCAKYNLDVIAIVSADEGDDWFETFINEVDVN